MGHRFASVFALAHALACASLVFASVVGGTSTNDGGSSDRDSDRLLPMFTTAAQEVVDEIVVAPQPGDLPVPAWLRGRFLQNSASQYEFNNRHLEHTFDGYAKILQWRFNGNGSVGFRARFLQSTFREKSEKQDDVCPARMFGHTSPKQGVRQAQALTDGCSDNYNVNVFPVGGTVVATSDVEGRAAVDEDLASSAFKWSDTWGHDMDKIAAAHPRRAAAPPLAAAGAGAGAGADAGADGVLSPKASLNYVMRINPLALTGLGNHSVILYAVDEPGVTPGTRRQLAKIKTRRLSYMHSLLATPRYAVLVMPPMTWDVTGLMAAHAVLDSMEWAPHDPTVIYVVDLADRTAPIRTFEVDAFFAFHHVNAYETENGDIVIDTVKSNTTNGKIPVATTLDLATMRNASARDAAGVRETMAAELRRYELPLSGPAPTSRIQPQVLLLTDADGRPYRSFELPQISPRANGRQHCFVYAWAPYAAGSAEFSDIAIVKKNVCDTAAPVAVWRRQGHFPGEPQFVPVPSTAPGAAEDDGVVLSAVLDGERESNYLLVLNATTMTTIARLYSAPAANHTMGFGIHGTFVSAS